MLSTMVQGFLIAEILFESLILLPIGLQAAEITAEKSTAGDGKATAKHCAVAKPRNWSLCVYEQFTIIACILDTVFTNRDKLGETCSEILGTGETNVSDLLPISSRLGLQEPCRLGKAYNDTLGTRGDRYF